MTAQPLLSSTILIRVMTVFLFVLTQKRVMAPFNDNVLGLMRVMCGTRVTLLSFGTKEYLNWPVEKREEMSSRNFDFILFPFCFCFNCSTGKHTCQEYCCVIVIHHGNGDFYMTKYLRYHSKTQDLHREERGNFLRYSS